jgi:hypothetical protein
MTPVEPPGPPAAFPSLAAMRAAHQDLLRSSGDRKRPSAERRRAVLEFLDAGGRTGAVLQSRADRSAAQALLDYWVGALYAAPAGPGQGPVPDVVLAEFDPARAPDLSQKPCPYMGLAAFLEKDADRFYGREEAVTALTEKVLREPVVLVAGPSGSGKSSLVLAGLLPALRAGPPDGSGGWHYLPVVVPGNDPVGLLLRALCPPGEDPRRWADEQRARALADPQYLRGLVGPAAGGRPALLLVDQFEELFTLCEDQEERKAYAALVAGLAGGPAGNRVVLTLREDFLREATQLPALAPLAHDPDARFSPPAMFARELRRVIERPAEMVGLTFDEGIIDDLVKEVAGEPTALPLLQFTLLRLWGNKERNRISWDAYRRVGSPREALKRTADSVYRQLPEDLGRQVARLVFLELVQPSVGVEFVRRRVRRESLRRLAASVTVDLVLARFTAAGLVRMTPGVDEDDDRFEVAHEALLRNWPMLADWLEGKRKQSEKELQLAAAARLWRESGRQEGYLLTGAALVDAQAYAERSPEIAELVAASRASQAFRQRVYRGAMTGAVAVLLAGLVVLLGLYSSERQANRRAAENARKAAERQALVLRQEAAAQKQLQEFALARLEWARQKPADAAVPPTQKRQRPVRPGLAIGTNTEPPSRGVLTAFVTDRRGADQSAQVALPPRRTYLLTLPLALSAAPLTKELRVYQPAPVAGKRPDEADVIAKVSRWVVPAPDTLNQATGVIAEVTLPPDEWSPNVYGFGPVTRPGVVKPGSYVQLVGASTVLKSGQVVGTGVRDKIQGLGGPDKAAEFDNLITVRAVKDEAPAKGGKPVLDDKAPFSQPGDIGAPVLTPEGELVGVVLAGSTGADGAHLTYALPIGSVLDALQVDLVRRLPSEK